MDVIIFKPERNVLLKTQILANIIHLQARQKSIQLYLKIRTFGH